MFKTVQERKNFAVTKEYNRLRQREEARAFRAMGMTNAEVAERMGLPETTIRRYTRGMA